jgi:hypothetical protein
MPSDDVRERRRVPGRPLVVAAGLAVIGVVLILLAACGVVG